MNQASNTYWQNLETETRSGAGGSETPEVRVPGLTLLAHPDLERIGER